MDVEMSLKCGALEVVECGEEAFGRIPLLCDGVEVGEVILSTEDFADAD